MSLKTKPLDIAEQLRSDEDIAAFITAVMEDGDAGELAQALGIAARAKGMTQIAKDAGIGRESLYKALRHDAQPRFDTVSRVCKALGVRLVALPVHAS